MRVLSLAALIVKWLVYKDNRGRVVIGLFQADFADSVKLANLELKGRKEGRGKIRWLMRAALSLPASTTPQQRSPSYLIQGHWQRNSAKEQQLI